MDFKAFEQLINDTANQKNLPPSTIIEDLAEILKLKYGVSIMEKERQLIDEVKNKVITKLYNTENHMIANERALSATIKLDALELDYLKPALDELTHEGLIKIEKQEITLTSEGVMKFKTFYGEI